MSEADIAELTNGLENLQIETSSNVTLDVGVENAEETTANQDINNSKSVDLKTETPEESETESDDESEVDSEASEDRIDSRTLIKHRDRNHPSADSRFKIYIKHVTTENDIGVIKSDGYILACNPSTVWEEQYDGFTIKLEIPVAFFQVDGRYSRPKTSFPSLLKERNRNRVVEYSYPGIQMNFNSLDLGDNNEFRMFLLERPKSHDKNKRATVLLIHEDSVDSDGNKWYSRILDVGGVELDIANNPYLMKQPGWPWQLVFAGQNDYLKLGIAHNVSIGKPEVNFQVLNYKHVFAGRL